jgi:uncharacterized protein
VQQAKDTDDLYWKKAHSVFATNRLELTIFPTEQCNFRCVYCYEDYSIGRMPPEIVKGVKNLLSRRAAELSLLQIRWFGGEPLLALDIIEDVALHSVHLSDVYPSLQYFGSITTNGSLLTLKVAERLCELGIRAFQITLDGPQPLHDGTRLSRTGGGTYDKIHANLSALHGSKLPVEVELRLHLTPDNVSNLDAFADELCERYLVDRRFRLEFFPIENLGGPNAGKFGVLDHGLAVRVATRLRNGVKPRIPTLADVGDRYVCYAAMVNAFVVRANGHLAKCTTALSDTRNDVGVVLEDGSLLLDQGRCRAWLHGWGARDWSALQCPLDGLPPQSQLVPLIVNGSDPGKA